MIKASGTNHKEEMDRGRFTDWTLYPENEKIGGHDAEGAGRAAERILSGRVEVGKRGFT